MSMAAPLPFSRAYTTTPIGLMEVCASVHGICGAKFVDAPEHGILPAHPPVQACIDQLTEYFAGTRTEFTVELDMAGPPYYLRVWQRLRAIPFGKRITYLDLANMMQDPNATRAVGGANARNPVWVIVPCHRVVGSAHSLTDNDLRGYAGGVPRKRWLLEHEQRLTQGYQTALF